MKKIFIREKGNFLEIKCQIVAMIGVMAKRLIGFLIVTFLVLIFSFLYIISFNYVYYFTQFEWIKSSIFIIIFVDILYIIVCFISISIRFISFKCKSERLYKLSNTINRV